MATKEINTKAREELKTFPGSICYDKSHSFLFIFSV